MEDQRDRFEEGPTSGPSGRGPSIPTAPQPPPHTHTPAVHDDGAGAPPVALVHLSATRNGREGQRAPAEGKESRTHTCGPLFLFPHVPGQRRRRRAGRGVG